MSDTCLTITLSRLLFAFISAAKINTRKVCSLSKIVDVQITKKRIKTYRVLLRPSKFDVLLRFLTLLIGTLFIFKLY